MDLSLEEIIQQNKAKGIAAAPSTKKFGVANNKKSLPLRKTSSIQRPAFKDARRITDARLKIIQKNRAKLVDARDKLAEITRASGDARQRLLAKRHVKGASNLSSKTHLGNGSSSNGYRSSISTSRLRQISRKVDNFDVPIRKIVRDIPVRSISNGGSGYRNDDRRMPEIPRGYVDYDDMERMEQEEYAKDLHRIVQNDVSYDHYPTYGSSSRTAESIPPAPRRLNSWGSNSESFDPFDVYEVPPHSRHERHLAASELPPPPPKGILRSSGSSARQRSPLPDELYGRRYRSELPNSHLSYEMRSRLERAPDPHMSMGIFANSHKEPMHTNNPSGYRIVVSNLHSSVTHTDIRELFADIGPLHDSRIVRPGVAEVIFKTLTDAEKAVDTYHNRQLDGQPMKCLLVNPRSSDNPTAPAIKSSRNNSGKTPLEIDIDALHKVLFRRN